MARPALHGPPATKEAKITLSPYFAAYAIHSASFHLEQNEDRICNSKKKGGGERSEL